MAARELPFFLNSSKNNLNPLKFSHLTDFCNLNFDQFKTILSLKRYIELKFSNFFGFFSRFFTIYKILENLLDFRFTVHF